MDLLSYAELAVLLVNGEERLTDAAGLRALLAEAACAVAPRQPAGPGDLDALRALRKELVAIFQHADAGDVAGAVDRLNALLVRHPVRPQLSAHDGQRWHLHLAGRGRFAEQYAACAVMGLAALVTTLGADRLGLCRAVPCRRAYLDTSANRSRRYCSERCASRANVAAYRARRRRNGQ